MIYSFFIMNNLGTNPDTVLKYNRITTLQEVLMFVEYDKLLLRCLQLGQDVLEGLSEPYRELSLS
jgi:hypothetical protein